MRRVIGAWITMSVLATSALARAPIPKKDPAKETQIAASIPTCTGEADCAAKWDAAQLWVVKHSSYKLQTVTNVLMETYGTGQAYTSDTAEVGRVFAQVTKEPTGEGSYRIVANIGCVLWIRNFAKGGECVGAQDLTLDFNATVSAARAPANAPATETSIAAPKRTVGVRVTSAGCSANAIDRLKTRGLSEQAIQEICAD
jgi:hypothetical protein